MKLSARQVAVLRVLAEAETEHERGLFAGRIGRLAGFRASARVDVGTTGTLDALARRGYAMSARSTERFGRRWWITEAGRSALGEYAFGEV